jgi:hypothetical protein
MELFPDCPAQQRNHVGHGVKKIGENITFLINSLTSWFGKESCAGVVQGKKITSGTEF